MTADSGRVDLHDPAQRAAYEVGYRDGESSHAADWDFALNEVGGFPDDFDIGPMKVAEAVAALRTEVERLRGGELAAVAATLRYLRSSAWITQANDYFDQILHFIDNGYLWDDVCCPMCEEVSCDQDCPLRAHRYQTQYEAGH